MERSLYVRLYAPKQPCLWLRQSSKLTCTYEVTLEMEKFIDEYCFNFTFFILTNGFDWQIRYGNWPKVFLIDRNPWKLCQIIFGENLRICKFVVLVVSILFLWVKHLTNIKITAIIIYSFHECCRYNTNSGVLARFIIHCFYPLIVLNFFEA